MSILKEMRDITYTTQNSLANSLEIFLEIENDTKNFLNNFFQGEVNKNFFLTQVFYYGDECIYKFQEKVFYEAVKYFTTLINIEGAIFSYNSSIFMSNIAVIVEETEICHIDIFRKQIILINQSYFTEIDNRINELEESNTKLSKQIAKETSYYKNPTKKIRNNHKSTLQSSIKLIGNKTIMKGKFKKEQREIINNLSLELSLNEDKISKLLITRFSMEKNMQNIQYYQHRVVERVTSNLKYSIIEK